MDEIGFFLSPPSLPNPWRWNQTSGYTNPAAPSHPVPKDPNPQQHCCQNRKSYKPLCFMLYLVLFRSTAVLHNIMWLCGVLMSGACCSTVQRRCIPIDSIDVKFVVESVVSGSLELLFNIIGNFTDDLKYREVAVFTEISTFLDRCIYRQMLSGTDILTCVSLIQTQYVSSSGNCSVTLLTEQMK